VTGTQSWNFTPNARPADRAQRVVNQLLADAKRGPAMVTNVEQRLTGLGRRQMETVVAQLFSELAHALADQKQ
jgi:hypothetical protein